MAVTNTGQRTSDEVVQLYLATPDATVPAPRLRLAAFARVSSLAPGQTARVQLTVAAAARAVMSAAGARAKGDAIYAAGAEQQVEPGRLLVHVGGGQPGPATATLNTTVVIHGEATRLSECV